MLLRVLSVLALCLVLASCSSVPDRSVGRGGGTPGEYKVGNPYEIGGIQYTPREDYRYSATGVASWYGPGFEGKRTANGETFDPNELTAAHQTLPMPSLVRVTNLENGRSVVVRINDRGPFANNRIIDLSRRAAQLLDFVNQGTAKVRVDILEIESRAIANAARRRGYVAPDMQSASNTTRMMPPPPVAEIPAAEVNSDEEIKVSDIGAQSVEAVPLDAPQASGPEAEPVAAPVQKAVYTPPTRRGPAPLVAEPKIASVAGKNVGGRFLPAPEIKQMKVAGSKNLFIQVGAFTVQENAQRLMKKMSSLAQTSVSEAKSGGKQFYRVRLGPLKNVEEADRILAKVLPDNNQAHITVE